MKGSKKPSHALESMCLKDLDIDFKFVLESALRRDLFVQVASDAGWLSRMGLIDYSLLVGVHFVSGEADAEGSSDAGAVAWRSRFQTHHGGMHATVEERRAVIFVSIIDW